MTFEVTLEDFKKGVAEFCKAVPDCDIESLENGMKAVGLMYLSLPHDPMDPHDALTTIQAKSYLEYAQRRYMERQTILEYGYDPLQRLKSLVGL